MQSGRSFPKSITESYTVYQLLGKGAFGSVYLVKDRYDYTFCALKIIDKNTQPVSNEAKVMMQLDHPHITNCFEQIETNRKFYIVMEYMNGGSLAGRLDDQGNFSEYHAKLYFYQMCLAVQYLHDNDVTHRDLKPDNMLLASEDTSTLLKVSDFGLSNYCSNYMYSCVGDQSYVAPEVVRHEKYGREVDIWSLGVVLFECLCGDYPFESQSDMLQGWYGFDDDEWDYVSNCAKSLIKSILKIDTNRRCNIKYILKSPWLNDYNMRQHVTRLQNRFD